MGGGEWRSVNWAVISPLSPSLDTAQPPPAPPTHAHSATQARAFVTKWKYLHFCLVMSIISDVSLYVSIIASEDGHINAVKKSDPYSINICSVTVSQLLNGDDKNFWFYGHILFSGTPKNYR